MKSGKRSILQKMLYLHFMMMPVRHPFSAFAPENTPLLRENQSNYIRFDSLNPPFHYPLRARFQPEGLPGRRVGSTSRRPEPMIAQKLHFVPNIPEFQHSNWGEAPNLAYFCAYGVYPRPQGLECRIIAQFRYGTVGIF